MDFKKSNTFIYSEATESLADRHVFFFHFFFLGAVSHMFINTYILNIEIRNPTRKVH